MDPHDDDPMDISHYDLDDYASHTPATTEGALVDLIEASLTYALADSTDVSTPAAQALLQDIAMETALSDVSGNLPTHVSALAAVAQAQAALAHADLFSGVADFLMQEDEDMWAAYGIGAAARAA